MNTKLQAKDNARVKKNCFFFFPQKYLRMTEDQIENLCKDNLYFQKIKQGNTYFTLQFGTYEI